jgi:hypothetical protein
MYSYKPYLIGISLQQLESGTVRNGISIIVEHLGTASADAQLSGSLPPIDQVLPQRFQFRLIVDSALVESKRMAV